MCHHKVTINTRTCHGLQLPRNRFVLVEGPTAESTILRDFETYVDNVAIDLSAAKDLITSKLLDVGMNAEKVQQVNDIASLLIEYGKLHAKKYL